MPKRGILFVDDEPHILSGMKRLLRPMRHEFEFYFCESGTEALTIMEESPIHVIVSDMKMPGISGADLLIETQKKFPDIVRIMLTGQADEESVYKAVNVVHQFLAKPCEPEKLKNIITQAATLHDLLSNTSLKKVITRVGSLPCMPAIYTKLEEVLNSPDVIADDVAKIIELDVAITAKLLQLLNSSFFGLFTHVDTPSRAVKLLGIDTIKILVLGLEVFSQITVDPTIISIDDLWEHSLLVAKCSRAIAISSCDDTTIINDSYISGLLHDVGRLLLIAETPDTYRPVLQSAQQNELHLLEEEYKTYGATHGDAGAYLVSLWGFNADIIEAVGFHNNCSKISAQSFSPALAVHVANFFYHQNTSPSLTGLKPTLDNDYIDAINMGHNVSKWAAICEEIILESRQEH